METELYLLISIIIILFIFVIILLVSQRKLSHEFDQRMDAFEQRSLQNQNNAVSNASQTLLTSLNQSSLSQISTLEIINRTLKDSSMMEQQSLNSMRASLENSLLNLNQETGRKLDDMRRIVDEKLQDTLNKRLSESFQSVSDQLQKVHEGLGEMQNLANGVGDLKKVLSNVKTRGILGEIQLGRILSEILASSQYQENINTIPNSHERVEFAICLPGTGGQTVYLPIDSKFPLDLWQRLQEAYSSNNLTEIAQMRKELVQRLKKDAKDIHDKYIQIPYTTDFAILFLPTEGLYSTACELGMMEQLQREYKVTLCGPSTMAAFLNSLQMGFQTLSIQQRSGEVWQLLAGVKAEFETFESVLKAAQSRIQQTSDELDKLVGVRTRAINRQLRSVTENGPALIAKNVEEEN